jgi:hypothetical protein
MHERVDEPEGGHDRAQTAGTEPRGLRSLAGEVLRLQRLAGNRAVRQLVQRQPGHDRGHAGEQGAAFHFYRFEDGWAVVRGPSGAAGHGITQRGEDGLMFNRITKELHVVDNKSLKAERDVGSATAIDPRRNLRRNLRDMIRYVRGQPLADLPMRQEVLSRLSKTWAAIDEGRPLPARVSLVVTNYGGRSTGVTDALARQGVTFRDVNDPLVVRPSGARPPTAPGDAPPPGRTQPSQRSGGLVEAAKRRAGSNVTRRDRTSGGPTRFPRGRSQAKIGSSRGGPRRQAAGVVVQTATDWVSDKSLNHAVASHVLGKWSTIEGWRAAEPNHFIVFEIWLQEADVRTEAGTHRMVWEVNAYHGPTIEDVERQIAAADRLAAPGAGWHLVGPYMGWIEPGQDLGELKAKVENEKCFIATACCGTETAPEVVTLRAFRDRVLAPRRAGRACMRAYYRASPAPACYIARRPRLRRALRRALVAPAAAAAARSLLRSR